MENFDKIVDSFWRSQKWTEQFGVTVFVSLAGRVFTASRLFVYLFVFILRCHWMTNIVE